MYDDDPEWEETPEAKFYREAADAEARWKAWCDIRIEGLLRSIPFERIRVPSWRAQKYFRVKRWK